MAHKKLFRTFLFVIPIIVLIGTMFLSSYMFSESKTRTYQRIKSSREDQVRILVKQIDGLSQEAGGITDVHRKILKNSVERINEGEGVYCFLFDKDFSLQSGYSVTAKAQIGQKIVEEFIERQDEVKTEDIQSSFGHLLFTIEKPNDYEIYWQEVPTGDGSEYYVVLGVLYQELQDDESTNTAKILLGSLNLVLSISIYGNLYLYDRIKSKDKNK